LTAICRALLAFMAMLPALALAQTPRCSILNFGIFRDVQTYGSREAGATPGGIEFLARQRASVLQTDRVPGRIGVLFGVVHRFEDIPAGGLIAAVIRHPPLPAKDGGTMTESLLRKEPDAWATGFRFDRAEEIVAGEWTFEFQYESHVLCRKTFVVETPK
jgi:Domain of unknown function (DUF3859)